MKPGNSPVAHVCRDTEMSLEMIRFVARCRALSRPRVVGLASMDKSLIGGADRYEWAAEPVGEPPVVASLLAGDLTFRRSTEGNADEERQD